ncbi:hypothetical protein JCM11491_007180 [Sporobolomyces phaffii]
MSSANGAPPSPTKRILRSIVTGVQPTDPVAHAQRWSKAGATRPGDATSVGGARVRGLVDEYERSFSSKPYSAMPQASTSPIKTNFASSPTSVGRNLPVLGSTQAPRPSPSPTSPLPSSRPAPDGRSPTTVPASFFQSRQTPPPSPNGAKFLPSPVGKENQPRPTFHPSPRSHASPLPPRSPTRASPPVSSTGGRSGDSDVSNATSAISSLTLETMATRSSNSTHASGPSTSSAEQASVRTASRVQLDGFDLSTPTKVHVTQVPLNSRSTTRAPQIVETAATPSRRLDQKQMPALPPHPVVEQHPPSPPLPPRSPCGSSFVEALPASYPSRSPGGSPLPSPSASNQYDYKPLPLANPPPSPDPSGSRQVSASRPKPRARASTLGSGLKPSFASEAIKPETAEEKRARVEADFDKLLDTMELPDRTVRAKMQGLAFPLKEEMLRSAAPSSLSTAASRPGHHRGRSFQFSDLPPSATTSASSSTKGSSGFKSTFLRKTKSNTALRNSTNSPSANSDPAKGSHSRTTSASTASILLRSLGRSSGGATAAEVTRRDGPTEGDDPAWWAERLGRTLCSQLSVKELGRLRGRLRNEAPGWVDDFIKAGGYSAMLTRLKELLEMEWREEQHDDQVLHELLRAFKALTLTACGKRALASYYPTPFLPIASLLFSEKRPGDLPCRQILVELLAAVFEICPIDADTLSKSAWASPEISLESPPPSPPTSSFMSPNPSNSGLPGAATRRYQRKVKSSDTDADSIEREEVLTPERVQGTHRFLISLMEGPPDEKEEAKVDFIKQSHRPRIFKAWVTEIGDCVRDYFWIFCHSQNLFWTFEQLDVDAIEAPKVPSGMTGGVEYEAMAYATAHFRLINAIARTCPTPEAAFAFHDQLFQSGFERVLFTLRRASLVYYQSLHLEMSRYIALARSARFNLGPRILSCLDRRFLRQEELMVVHMMEQREHQSRSGAPQIGMINV